MSENNTVMLTGRVYWFKALGAPRMNDFENKRQWSFDLEVTPETRQWLKENGLLSKIKKTENGELKTTPDGDNYISFRRDEFTREGDKNKMWRVVDSEGHPWEAETLVGNGSKARVKVKKNEYKVKGKTIVGLYAQAIQIGEHVEYVSNEFGSWEDEAPKAKAKAPAAKKDALEDVLDDDNPFDE
jgi:hypothetical protein